MALAFRGFALIKLVKAVGGSTLEGVEFSYEVTIHDHFGRVKHSDLKIHTIDKEWCKLRMEGDRFAMMCGGVCKPITEEEYISLLKND